MKKRDPKIRGRSAERVEIGRREGERKKERKKGRRGEERERNEGGG